MIYSSVPNRSNGSLNGLSNRMNGLPILEIICWNGQPNRSNNYSCVWTVNQTRARNSGLPMAKMQVKIQVWQAKINFNCQIKWQVKFNGLVLCHFLFLLPCSFIYYSSLWINHLWWKKYYLKETLLTVKPSIKSMKLPTTSPTGVDPGFYMSDLHQYN